ncbi:integrase catalytic domain-containing protein [Trichonephila clavipes]|nr:integrase catalytic domain-containing protein [Trichonephila clavipes]
MQFWPINGKGIARKTVHDCIACFRQKPTGVDQLMGNLPSERVTPSAPFLNSGVDFCGPFQIKFKNQRKGIFSKVYVAIFVCLATKAIHLEAVTDLTTEAFIAALKRLCARRGRISTLMSDNATNFKGAAAELNRFIKLICNKNETLANYFASEAIQWKFIPPRSPNFGGLWEAGVKSFKHHLYRTLVNSKITFEEFETIIIQIEGILNSRPLVPLSDNINEYEVLTPGHFIIGRPISAIPEPAILDISDNRLSRWQYTTKCVQTIWKRWKNDYLNHLQQRNKWQFEKNNVAVGCLVLLKENDLPPANGQWQESWRLFMELTIVDKECEPLYSPTEIDKEIEAVEQYFDKIVTWRFRAKKQLGKNNKFKSDSDSCKTTEESKLIEPMKVKLPKLIIPKFYGEINQWLSFWNSFKTAIHDNNSLNSIDKFTYLKGLLGSSALATVEGFAITAENYAKAVEILKDRFGRKDAIINSHMQKLLSVTPLKRSDDTKVLRQFFDMCQTQIRSLESLDVSFESFSNVLCPLILNCLPSDLVLEFNKETDGSEYKLDELLKF